MHYLNIASYNNIHVSMIVLKMTEHFSICDIHVFPLFKVVVFKFRYFNTFDLFFYYFFLVFRYTFDESMDTC